MEFGSLDFSLKKFTKTWDISDWEIETDSGWEDIVSLHETIPYKVWLVKFEDDSELRCADNHILFTSTLEEVFVKDLKVGDLIYGRKGFLEVNEIKKLDEEE